MPDRPAALGEDDRVLRLAEQLIDGTFARMRIELQALLDRAYAAGVAAGREEAARIAEQHCEQSPITDTGSMWRSSAATTIAAAIRRLYPR
jgi:hypothetical protein